MDLIKINPAEYGLEETKAQQIEKSFAAVTVERNGIIAIYEELITSEITPEICERAGKLSTALSKVNASLNRVHKAQKLYYLSGGRFCDAIKNRDGVIIEEMQKNLIALKDHEENERKAKIAKLQAERSEQIEKYIDIIPPTLGMMTKDIWDNFFSGTKTNYKIQKEAEKKSERQRIEKEKKAREEKKRIIAENEKLKKAEDDRIRLRKIEREKKTKRFESRKAELIQLGFTYNPNTEYNFLLKDTWSCFHEQIENPEEKEYQEYLSSIKHAMQRKKEAEQRVKEETERLKKENEAKTIREEKERKERKENEAKLQTERDERERIEKEARAKQEQLENELKEKAEIEAKRLQAIEDKKQAELNKGDSEKVKDLINDLKAIKTEYVFESEKNKKMYSDIGGLIDKVVNYIIR